MILARRSRQHTRHTLGRNVWVPGLAVLMTLICVGSAVAQVVYQTFPVRQGDLGERPQPTRQGTKVTVIARDSTIDYVVHEIARQAHWQVVFTNDASMSAKRISTNLVDVQATEALASVLKGSGLTAKLAADGETVIVHAQSRGTVQQYVASGVIAGRVTDSSSGSGLSGATVRVEGLKLSVVTSDSGHFELKNVPAGDQALSVKLFGYRPVERSVTVVDSQRTIVRIVMVPIPTVLSGVVTTATGAQRKVEVGNDITSLNVDSIMRVAPVNSVTDLLETRVPGLTVLHSSGEPGNPSRLRLRGVGSISGNNDPIVIIDGIRVYSSQSDARNANLAPSASLKGYGSVTVNSGNSVQVGQGTASARNVSTNFAAPSPIDQIDPNSIETIEVFKGPSASALYGSDAANGVIVITTKRGRAGPTQWSLNLGGGVNWIPGSWPKNYFRFGTNAHDVGPVCNWYDPTCSVIDSVRSFQALNDPAYTVFSHGSNQTADFTVTGGVPTLQYSLTGSGSGQMGNLKLPAVEQQRYGTAYGATPSWMVRPDNYTTWGVGGSITASPSQTFRATWQSNLFNSAQQSSSLQGAIPMLEGVYISEGYATYYDGTLNSLALNPLVTNYVERITDNGITTQNNLTLSWQPRSWLPITANGGIQSIQRTDHAYIPYGVNSLSPTGCGAGDVQASSLCSSDTSGYYGLGRGLTHNQTLTAGTILPVFHQRVALAVGGNLYTETTNDFQAATNQLAPGVSSPTSFFGVGCGNGNVTCRSTQSSTSSSTYGWYFEPRLNFNSRFFAAPGFRLDGGSGGTHASSNGGATGGLSAFPKLDLSYVAVDHQSGHPLWGFLTLLRPRVAFGLAGTQPAPQDRLRLITGTTNTLNETVVSSIGVSTLGNTQLHPERSSELEGGLDATLWNGRFTVTYTQYNKTRKDAIIDVPIAPSISQGLSGTLGQQFMIAENIGEVRNTGTELTLNATVLETRALSWNIGANLSNDNNVLVRLNRGQSANYGLGLVPGYPLFGQWVRPIVAFADQNQDGYIESREIRIADSLIFVGQPNPKYQLNLNTGLTLLNGRLSVNATFAYQDGLTQENLSALNSASFLMIGNNPSTSLAYQAAVQGVLGQQNGSDVIKTSYGLIQTVNTFRFNDLSVNYQLPRQLASWLRVPRASVAIQGSNLGLHSNYRGKDPDVNAFSTVSSSDLTADLGQVPEPRTWWLKLTLGN